MERLLQTSHFRNSRRYPALFRYIVEETLAGRGELLKERLLGIQVFGRPADYDTASDPIVRVTIAEIRKRIAQYYHEEAHESEMRIELNPGSYEPEFKPPREIGSAQRLSLEPRLQPTAAPAPEELPSAPEAPPAVVTHRVWPIALGATLAAACLVLGLAWAGWRWMHPSALEQLWAPILDPHKTVTFCLPTGAAKDLGATASAAGVTPPDTSSAASGSQTGAGPSFRDFETLGENVVFSDALATLRISNWMTPRQRDLRYRVTSATTLDDLRQGPDILIGGLDNQWALRSLASLPIRFAGADAYHYWILDTRDPSNHDWALNLQAQWGAVTRDYAIIARIHNSATGQVEVIVAGIGMSGTAAAGEFMIDPAQAEQLRRTIGPRFRDHDFEAVLSTDVVDGVAGAPKILTTAVW